MCCELKCAADHWSEAVAVMGSWVLGSVVCVGSGGSLDLLVAVAKNACIDLKG